MFYLEIWIRKGEKEYGRLILKESSSGEIRYEQSFQFHKSRKKTYIFKLSLEYREKQSRWDSTGDRWVFQGRSNNSVENDFIYKIYQKYSFQSLEFETSGKILTKMICYFSFDKIPIIK